MSPANPVPQSLPNPECGSAQQHVSSRPPADRNFCPAGHSGAKNSVGVFNWNFSGKGAHTLARLRLRTYHRNSIAPGALRITIKFDSRLLACVEQRGVPFRNGNLENRRVQIEHLRKRRAGVQMLARCILQIGRNHNARNGRT